MPKALIPYASRHPYLSPCAGIGRTLPVRQNHQTLNYTNIGCSGGEGSIEYGLGVREEPAMEIFTKEPGGSGEHGREQDRGRTAEVAHGMY